MFLRKFFREVVFIDINELNNRIVLLKLYFSLKDMLEFLINVELDNVLKRYKRRLKQMSKYCYVDFVIWFDIFLEKCKK